MPSNHSTTGFDYEDDNDEQQSDDAQPNNKPRLPLQLGQIASIPLPPSPTTSSHSSSSPSSSRSTSPIHTRWEPRSSTPMTAVQPTTTMRQPSPLFENDNEDRGDITPRNRSTSRSPPRSAWRNMPGFEDLDESWQPQGADAEQQQFVSLREESSPFPSRSSSRSSSSSRKQRGSQLSSNGSESQPKAGPSIRSDGQQNQSSASIQSDAQPSQSSPPSTSIRSEGQPKQSAPPSRSIQSDGIDPLRSQQPNQSSSSIRSDGTDPLRTQEPNQSSSSIRSGGLDHLRIQEPNQSSSSTPTSMRSDGLDHLRQSSPPSTSTSISLRTASEGEGPSTTFIHHSNVSDLPPILKPAWQRKEVNIRQDIFTPLKLQTMFKTPTPPGNRSSESKSGADQSVSILDRKAKDKDGQSDHLGPSLPVGNSLVGNEQSSVLGRDHQSVSDVKNSTSQPRFGPKQNDLQPHSEMKGIDQQSGPDPDRPDRPSESDPSPSPSNPPRPVSIPTTPRLPIMQSIVQPHTSAPTTPGQPRRASNLLAPHTVFTFRCQSSSTPPSSPFAHIGTPKSAMKRSGISAEAYAHLQSNRKPSFAMRLFRIKDGKTEQEATQLYNDRIQQLQSQKPAIIVDEEDRPSGPEKKRMRIERIIETDDQQLLLHSAHPNIKVQSQSSNTVIVSEDQPRKDYVSEASEFMTRLRNTNFSSTHTNGTNFSSADTNIGENEQKYNTSSTAIGTLRSNTATTTAIGSSRMSKTVSREEEEESPRKLFRRFSAAGSSSVVIDEDEEDLRREEQLRALEAKILARRLQKRPQHHADNKGPSEAIPEGDEQVEEGVPQVVVVDADDEPNAVPMPSSPRPAGMVNISPDEAGIDEMVKTLGRGKMSFDPATNRWLSVKGSNKQRPPLPPQPEPSPIESNETSKSLDTGPSSDSTDPFKDIESLETHTRGRPGYYQQESTPPPSAAVSVQRGTPPILKPRYALQQRNAATAPRTFATATTAPRSGSALRNEVNISDSGGDTSTSVLSHADEEQDDKSEKVLSALQPPQPSRSNFLSPSPSHRPSTSAHTAITPVRESSTPSDTPRQAPRSILKSANSSIMGGVTPVSSRVLQEPRSISFADGRKTGKMFSRSIDRSPGDDQRENDDNNSHGPTPPAWRRKSNSAVQSKESRIQFLLQELATLALGNSSEGSQEDKGRQQKVADVITGLQGNLLEVPQTPDEDDVSWQDAPSPTSRFSLGNPAASLRFSRGRSLGASSSSSRHPGGERSVWNFNESAADKTFLTQASFNVAHDRIVEVITDVAPWVPDWDDLKEIDLNGRKLESVLRLKEFLPNVESLRVDNNQIEYLTGLPPTLRLLSAASNRIPATVSFSHLRHLESLDISDNQIDDLNSLECLVHLRHLRVDSNGIQSLDGISKLENLHTLSLRGNRLTVLNLQETSWRKLTSLDVSHNRLLTIRSLSTCKHLRVLNLTGNRLTKLDLGHNMPKLRILRVSSNPSLTSLDILPAQDLRTLYADFCSLTRVEHLGTLQMLENLSLRQQRPQVNPRKQSIRGRGSDTGVKTLEWPSANQVQDIRRLFLSGNALSQSFGSLSASAPYSILVYLELSACQIDNIPSDFADIFPNIHHLNLDHNLFSKLPRGCFSGLSKLTRVSMVGCRIKRTRNLVEAFEGCEELSVLDTRMNPITLGIYPPTVLTSTTTGSAHLAPIPNFEMVRPDTFQRLAERNQVEEAASDQKEYEQSFFHKKFPLPSKHHTDDDDDDDEEDNPAPASIWAQSDTQFKLTLPESFALKRMLHRGTLGLVCPRLTWLDGLELETQEVHKAEEFLLLSHDES
ncbi:unnamed protein product [Sympodiomycopsis kandeliae]